MAWRETRGQEYIRTGVAIATGRGHIADAIDHAQRAWGRSSVPAVTLRAIAGGLTPASPAWGSELGDFNASAAELFELVLEQSIPGRIGVREVPLTVPLLSPDGGSTASWVAEHGRKPVTNMDFAASRLDANKVAGIVVMSEELVRLSQAEALVRTDLTRALAERLDLSFINPLNSGVAGEEPAAVTYGAPTVAATGNMRSDLRALVAAFEGDLTRASFIARPELYAQMAGADHPDVGIGDGQLLQRPAIASRNIPASASSPETFDLVLVDGSGIALGQGAASIDAARHAALYLEEGGAAVLVDLWSRNLVGIKGEQVVNWEVQRAGAVAVLTGIPADAS